MQTYNRFAICSRKIFSGTAHIGYDTYSMLGVVVGPYTDDAYHNQFGRFQQAQHIPTIDGGNQGNPFRMHTSGRLGISLFREFVSDIALLDPEVVAVKRLKFAWCNDRCDTLQLQGEIDGSTTTILRRHPRQRQRQSRETRFADFFGAEVPQPMPRQNDYGAPGPAGPGIMGSGDSVVDAMELTSALFSGLQDGLDEPDGDNGGAFVDMREPPNSFEMEFTRESEEVVYGIFDEEPPPLTVPASDVETDANDNGSANSDGDDNDDVCSLQLDGVSEFVASKPGMWQCEPCDIITECDDKDGVWQVLHDGSRKKLGQIQFFNGDNVVAKCCVHPKARLVQSNMSLSAMLV